MVPKKAASSSKANGKSASSGDAQNNNRKVTVNWAVPKAKRLQELPKKHINPYAQRLYGLAPERLTPGPSLLPDAQIRTPIFRAPGKDLSEGDVNQSSAALRDFFNDVKGWSLTPKNAYRINNLSEHFEDGNTALVLSRAADDEILALDEDRRLEV